MSKIPWKGRYPGTRLTASRDGPDDDNISSDLRGKLAEMEILSVDDDPKIQQHVKQFVKEFLSVPPKIKKKRKGVLRGYPGLLGLSEGFRWSGEGADTINDSGAAEPSGDSGGNGGNGGGDGGGMAAASSEPKDKELEMPSSLRKEMDLSKKRKRESAPPPDGGYSPQEGAKELGQLEDAVDVPLSEVVFLEEEGAEMEAPAPAPEAPAEEAPAAEEPAAEEMKSEDEPMEDAPAPAEEAAEEAAPADEEAREKEGDTMHVGKDYKLTDADIVDVTEADVEAVYYGDYMEAGEYAMEEEQAKGGGDVAMGPDDSQDEPMRMEQAADKDKEEEEMLDEEGMEMMEEEPAEEACPAPEPEEEMDEEMEMEDDEAKEAAAEPAPAPESAPAVATEAVVGEADEEPNVVFEFLAPNPIEASVDVEDVTLYLHGEETTNPHYVVLVSGDPIAKIAFTDQTLPAEHIEMFLDENYPGYILEGIERFGLAETLKHVNGRYYAAQAYKGSIAEAMKTQAAAEMQDVHRESVAKLKDSLISTASIVMEGSMKNYLSDNPLKDAIVAGMRSVGVDEAAAIDLVEDAWREAGVTYFASMLAKAEEWLGAPKEVLDHHIKEISGASYRHPGYDSVTQVVDQDIPEAAAPMPKAAHAMPKSVPLRTASPTPAPGGQWDKKYWKNRLNLHGKTVRASLSKIK